jgi:hypothetical protein
VFCACLLYHMHHVQYSSFTPYLQQSINQSINHAPSTIAAPRLANSVNPTGGFGESGEREMTCCPSASRRMRSSLDLPLAHPTATTPSFCIHRLYHTPSIPYTTLRQQTRPCATTLEPTRLTRLRRRQLSCNVVSRPSCANREPTPSTCMFRYLSSSTITQPDIICLVALSLADDKLFLLQCSPASAPLPKWPALHWHARRRPA